MQTRTRYRKSIKSPDAARLLKPGKNNKKLGGKVTKGRHKGKQIYSLTLEERATCPTTCHHWDDCYGNNMPFAHRFEHGQELEDKLEIEVAELTKKHKDGILIRLHVLGDFYSPEYVFFWSSILTNFPTVAIYGYTARYYDFIGSAIAIANCLHPSRWDVRYSENREHSKAAGFSFAASEEFEGEGFQCPEQVGKVDSCADCALCWQTTKTVIFRSH